MYIICFLFFNNEEEAVEYVIKEYNLNKDGIINELCEEEGMREKFGKDNYLRSASVSRDILINELMSGEYILWVVY